MRISGNIVDVLHERIYPGTLDIRDDRILHISEDREIRNTFIIPGFIDSHVHIESSMLVPSEFARIAAVHGTVGTVSDPHEIGNVLGVDGVRFMIENGKLVPFTFWFGAPSCVPSSPFETSGASLGPAEVDGLLGDHDIRYLSEVMNVPGVLNGDMEVAAKLASAKRHRKVIDGHAPALRGQDLAKYIGAGISTDHETFAYDEGAEKLSLGMKLCIREGSAARNLYKLGSLMDKYPDSCMLCTDDMHPHDLTKGHIDRLVQKAVEDGIDTMKVLRCACVNPVRHYGLPVGLLQKGDRADFLVVDNLNTFTVLETYIKGQLAARGGMPLLPRVSVSEINSFAATNRVTSDFSVKARGETVHVIEAINGEVITNHTTVHLAAKGGYLLSNPDKDILKITVVNRYQDALPSIGFVMGFGLKRGAIASSIAHDSHNIIAVGVDDDAICRAVNLIIECRGGIALVDGIREEILPLPIAGIMTSCDAPDVAHRYAELHSLAQGLGSELQAPFMTLSFMALPVIPKLKVTDKGLFDGDRFTFIDLFSS
ncbi:MAG: Adenine deaminase [Syntrophorhabdus sp. PtaU1.Bin050]|nr:MAG: Adenine deaminase [Syntrophorhabdus sp. PtaU1.Bin050]